MEKIAKFFIENHKLTIVLSLGLSLYGLMGLRSMNAESYPAVSFATATVVTSYDGASAEDIEVKITKPIEDEIRGVSGLKDVRSTSQAGLSTIVVRVDMDDSKVDVEKAMTEIQKAVDRTSKLPQDLKDDPIFTELKSEEFPVVELAVVGDNTNRARDLIAEKFKEELEDNTKIKDVRLTGFGPRAFQIALDLKKLASFHISIDEVLQAIRQRNTNIPGGAVKGNLDQSLIRVEGKIRNVEELKKIIVRANFSGQTIHLEDVAQVSDAQEELMTEVKYNGEEATLIVITKKAGADTLKLVKELDAKILEYKERNPDYKFHIYHNEGKQVQNKINVLASNAWQGLVLVVVFLFLFLPGRVGMMASISLPLSIFGTTGIMGSLGYNLDAITILALVISMGMLVDNAVVIAENFVRLKKEGMDDTLAATESVRTLWLPITATAFTTIAAFLPMLVTKGVMGQFIKYIPVIVTASLLVSLAESFLFLPMRLKIAGKNIKSGEEKKVDWFEKFEKKFENFMASLIKRRYITLGVFSLVIIASFILVFVANKFILFPADQTEIYTARIELPKGTVIKETNREIGELSQEIKQVFGDKIEHIIGRAGVSRMDLGDPKAKEGSNVGMLVMYVNEDTKNNMPSTEFLKKIREIKRPKFKELSFEAMINGPPVGNPIEGTFKSNNLKQLDEIIAKIQAQLSQIPGVLNLQVNDVIGDDEVFVRVDYEKAARLGLDVNSIGNVIRTAVSGNRVSTVTLDNKDVDLIVRLDSKQRTKENDLNLINVLDPRGNLIPLSSFASFDRQIGAPQVKRYDFKRSKTLTGDVNEEIITSVVANKKLEAIFNELKKDFPGVTLVFGGAAESTKESMDSLFDALILSLVGIFALLVFLFKSYLRPAIIMSTIPLGLLGFGVAFFLHQRPVSFLALIGIIGLGGIIVNSGIVLISFIDDMKAEGKLALHEILAKASGLRLRAVLVTSLTTISGLIPTAYGIGGTDAMLVPMTLALAWGLTSGTVLTLIWVPCAYAILEDYTLWMDQLGAKIKRLFSRKNKTATNFEVRP
jgi:multidrug efflux pump subunit AcrB